jgi:prepilin-type processing-associated H-X9-DG protein
MEQKNVQGLINFTVSYNDPLNATARATEIPFFNCPSDPQSNTPVGMAGTSYRCNQGSGILWQQPSGSTASFPEPSGPFVPSKYLKLASIVDGLSNTAGFSEHGKGDYDNALSTKTDTFKPGPVPNTPDEAVAYCNATNETDLGQQGYSLVGVPWLQGYHSTTTYFHVNTPNQRSCMYPPGRINTTAQSNHPGGVNVTLCDGSVRFASQTVNLLIWRAVGTRDGNESLTDF